MLKRIGWCFFPGEEDEGTELALPTLRWRMVRFGVASWGGSSMPPTAVASVGETAVKSITAPVGVVAVVGGAAVVGLAMAAAISGDSESLGDLAKSIPSGRDVDVPVLLAGESSTIIDTGVRGRGGVLTAGVREGMAAEAGAGETGVDAGADPAVLFMLAILSCWVKLSRSPRRSSFSFISPSMMVACADEHKAGDI